MNRNILKTLAEQLSLALLLEVSSYPKPGNVHRLRDNPELKYEAFLATGIYSLKYFEKGIRRGFRGHRRIVIGDLVYGLLSDVLKEGYSNTCLGSSLLLSLMSVSLGRMIRCEIRNFNELGRTARESLEETSVYDTIYYYKAVRKAAPSYLKPSDKTNGFVNIWDSRYKKKIIERNHRLIDVLKYSAKFDVVAREAINGFEEGFRGEVYLRERLNTHGDLNRAIVETYLYLLSRNIDTIVLLKHGEKTAREIQDKARVVHNTVVNAGSDWVMIVNELDREFYSRGINPGSIADLVVEVLGLFLIRNKWNTIFK